MQNAYWQMHDLIFEKQTQLVKLPFDLFAKTLGLDAGKLVKDLEDPALSARVEADFASGLRSGVNGTPSFFINAVAMTAAGKKNGFAGRMAVTLEVFSPRPPG